MKHIALVVAAGNATRCGFDKLRTRQFGVPVLEQTLQLFERCDEIDGMVVVGETLPEFVSGISKIVGTVPGGDTRFESVKKGILWLAENESDNCRVVVHNAANPFLTQTELRAALEKARSHVHVICGFYAHNALKRVEQGVVADYLPRAEVFETQTPQISDLNSFQRALRLAEELSRTDFLDEAELLSLLNEPIVVQECAPQNYKITTAEDFSNTFRIGVGQDTHELRPKIETDMHHCVLGGIEFPEESFVLKANSDGDPILHALCNALLSAIGESPFSSFADEMCQKGITDSVQYLKKTLQILGERFPSYQIQNVAISLELARPRLGKHHQQIQQHVAQLLSITPAQVGLMYTSGDGTHEHHIAAQVQVLLRLGV